MTKDLELGAEDLEPTLDVEEHSCCSRWGPRKKPCFYVPTSTPSQHWSAAFYSIFPWITRTATFQRRWMKCLVDLLTLPRQREQRLTEEEDDDDDEPRSMKLMRTTTMEVSESFILNCRVLSYDDIAMSEDVFIRRLHNSPFPPSFFFSLSCVHRPLAAGLITSSSGVQGLGVSGLRGAGGLRQVPFATATNTAESAAYVARQRRRRSRRRQEVRE